MTRLDDGQSALAVVQQGQPDATLLRVLAGRYRAYRRTAEGLAVFEGLGG